MVSNKRLIAVTGIYTVIIVGMALMVRVTSRPDTIVANPESTATTTHYIVEQKIFEPQLVKASETTAKTDSTVPPQKIGPTITARAYLVGDIETGETFAERNINAVLPVASMSKLITAFVATDILDSDADIVITEDAMLAPPDTSGIKFGDTFTLKEILLPLLLNSSNIAAESLADNDSREKFLESMNSYAWEVGMPNSYFADPSGVSPSNAASATDLFGLAKYLYKFRRDILKITQSPRVSLASSTDHQGYEFVSTHPFVHDSRFIGGKTGRTPEAGETMLTILEIDSQLIAVIVLGSSYGAREADTRLLLQKIFP
ncbi:MAG: hypothetical protein M3Q80_00490 [bacterium]|nr:hypothetical protein [bacterium]